MDAWNRKILEKKTDFTFPPLPPRPTEHFRLADIQAIDKTKRKGKLIVACVIVFVRIWIMFTIVLMSNWECWYSAAITSLPDRSNWQSGQANHSDRILSILCRCVWVYLRPTSRSEHECSSVRERKSRSAWSYICGRFGLTLLFIVVSGVNCCVASIFFEQSKWIINSLQLSHIQLTSQKIGLCVNLTMSLDI